MLQNKTESQISNSKRGMNIVYDKTSLEETGFLKCKANKVPNGIKMNKKHFAQSLMEKIEKKVATRTTYAFKVNIFLVCQLLLEAHRRLL